MLDISDIDFGVWRFPLIFIGIIAGLGFFISRPEVILFLDTLNPVYILGLWYAVLGGIIYAVAKLMHEDAGHIHSFMVVIGLFAIQIDYGFAASHYVDEVTHTNASPVLLANEDGVVYYAFSVLGITGYANALLTYVAVPVGIWLFILWRVKPEAFDRIISAVMRNG